jgi:hypothetical protein
MRLGSFYEVSFNVEGWESSGSADVEMEMGEFEEDVAVHTTMSTAKAHNLNGRGHFQVTANATPKITFSVAENSYVSFKIYNFLGQEVAELPGKEFAAGEHSRPVTTAHLANGVYHYAMKTAGR